MAATRFKEDGSVLLHYQASWVAQLLGEGRMVMDEFKALAPTGQAVSSYVTLRTYSDTTQRWEMTGLAALQPAMGGEWHGIWTDDGEMLLNALGTNADGKTWLHTASLIATRRPVGL